jgi:hypothetical protein
VLLGHWTFGLSQSAALSQCASETARLLALRWTVDRELLLTDRQQATTAGDGLVPGCGDDQGAKPRIPSAELRKAIEIVRMKAACLYFAVTTTPLEHGVDFQRLFAPVRYPLPLVDSGKARIFHAQTEPRRLMLGIRRSVEPHAGIEGT